MDVNESPKNYKERLTNMFIIQRVKYNDYF